MFNKNDPRYHLYRELHARVTDAALEGQPTNWEDIDAMRELARQLGIVEEAHDEEETPDPVAHWKNALPAGSHYYIGCDCGRMISQCRCPSPNKARLILPAACPECRRRASVTRRIASDLLAGRTPREEDLREAARDDSVQ